MGGEQKLKTTKKPKHKLNNKKRSKALKDFIYFIHSIFPLLPLIIYFGTFIEGIFINVVCLTHALKDAKNTITMT